MIRIDLADPTPPYQQIRAGVLAAVGTGELVAGDRLPTVRQLSDDLGVAPGTVQRAYGELESDGVLESRGRRGTFVRATAERRAQDAGAALRAAARRFAEEAERLGVGRVEAVAAAAAAVAGREGAWVTTSLRSDRALRPDRALRSDRALRPGSGTSAG